MVTVVVISTGRETLAYPPFPWKRLICQWEHFY